MQSVLKEQYRLSELVTHQAEHNLPALPCGFLSAFLETGGSLKPMSTGGLCLACAVQDRHKISLSWRKKNVKEADWCMAQALGVPGKTIGSFGLWDSVTPDV